MRKLFGSAIMVFVLSAVVVGCQSEMPARSGVGNGSDLRFFADMSAGYECAFPDSEEALFAKGICAVGGHRCGIFAWRDENKRLNVAINTATNLPGDKGFVSITVSKLGKDLLDENYWVKRDQVSLTYISMGSQPDDDPMAMFLRIKTLEKAGVCDIDLLLPRR